MSVSASEFKAAMRGLASGVSLVTTCDAAGQRHGMAATAVISLSAEPPTLAICVNKSASMHGPVAEAGHFAVNFLSEGQADLVALFSSSEQREKRFAAEGWQSLTTGAPVHAEAMASLDCRLVQTLDAASHTLFVGEVLASRTRQGSDPLVFFNGGLGAFCAA